MLGFGVEIAVKNHLMVGIAAIAVATQAVFASSSVLDVNACQRHPWTGLVDISVTFAGTAEDAMAMKWSFAAMDCATKAAIPISHITRSGKDSGSGNTWTCRFVWNAKADVGAIRIDDVMLTVDAEPIGVQLWEDGPCWAECNVGAIKPEEYGYFFWWGDTVGYKRNSNDDGWVSVKDSTGSLFSSENCPTYNKGNSQLQKDGYINSTGRLTVAHDAAAMYCGAPWRMPTGEECERLVSSCDTEWTTHNGVRGRIVRGRGAYSSKSIFLPAAGSGEGSKLMNVGSYGFYWSSTLDEGSGGATRLNFNADDFSMRAHGWRCRGHTVRPVRGFINAMAAATIHLAIDCREGIRLTAGDEDVRYDAGWFEGGSQVCVTDNGVNIATGNCGKMKWMPTDGVIHCLEMIVSNSDGICIGRETAWYLARVPDDGAVVIPDGCSEIPAELFKGCEWLTSVRIPNSVTNIGTRAFYDCAALECIYMPCDIKVGEDAISTNVQVVSIVSVLVSGREESYVYDGLHKSYGVTLIPNTGRYDIVNVTDTLPVLSANIGTKSLKLTSGMFQNTNKNYEVTFVVDSKSSMSIVVISPRPVTLTTMSAQKVYDGMPLLAGFKIGGSGFVAGECEVETVGSQTAVGTSNNTIVLNWTEGALQTNYEITKDEGTLTVAKRPVSIVSKSAQKVYDGTPLTAGFDIGGSGFVVGECEVTAVGAQTAVGTSKNVLALNWAAGVLQTNYEISKQEGMLTVLPREVTLTSGTVSKNCDGVPLVCEGVGVTGDGFVGAEGVTTICAGIQIWPGVCDNSFEYTFKPGTTASNYNIKKVNGRLIVTASGVVSIASGVTEIPAGALRGCSEVTEIRIPDTVQCIGDDAFAGCTGLTKIDFPAGLDVTRAKLNSWGLSDEWIAQYCRIDDYLVAGSTLIQYVGDASVKKLTVPAGIVRIDKRAFAALGGLEEIEFSGTEKIIGKGAFFRDTKLTKVILHEGIEQIGDEAFFGCTKMANVIIPSSVKSVGAHAFKQCTALTNAQISYGVESIGEECFYSDWQIEQVDIPSTVTNIGVMAFGGDSSIIRAKLRADIRPMSEIFSNYKHIREVGVKICDREIVDGCFRDCVELKDVFWEGNCPRLANDGRELYANTWHGDKNETLTTYVEEESTGWDGIEGSDQLPQAWPLVGSCRCSIAHKDLPTYLCQFDSNGGTLGVQDTYQYSERLVKLPPEPVQSGYKFGGWWTQPNGGLRVTEKTIFIEGVYAYLWAHWIKGHTVFLDPNGGVIINGFVTYVDESVYGVLPSPVRSGYAFDGWLYDGHKVEPDTIMNTKADHTLLAQWRAAQYKVIYHPNGGVGNLVTEERVYGETEVLRRNAFVRPGYEFIGWSTHESATSAEYKDAEPVTSLTVVDGGVIELWAVWKESEAIDPTNVELAFGGDADWFKVHQLVEAQSGGQMVCTPCFWQSGKIDDNEKSDLTTKVFGAGKIGFWWRVDCEKVRTYKWDHLAFFVDNVEIVWTNGVTEWAYFEFAVDGSQEHELIWRYQKDVEGSDGEDCGAVCAIVWTPRLETLEDYAGATNMTLRTDGDAGWFGVKDEVHNQSGSVRSGVITDGQVSSLKSAVDGAGVIRFWWKTDCERIRNYPVDRVLFYVDGNEQAWTNGVSDWVQRHFTITGDGPHNVEWRYVKDEEGSSGRDCVWVSEIEWEPLRVPVAVVVPAEITGGKELVVDKSWPASLDAQFGAGTSAAFVEKFGSNLSAALLKPTGKKSAAGEDMYVWQDYVAGTDPTDPKSQFTAKIEMVDGEPVIIWSPKLSEAEAAKRIYTTYGRKTLEAGESWTPVATPAQGGWRFFKIGVEMR